MKNPLFRVGWFLLSRISYANTTRRDLGAKPKSKQVIGAVQHERTSVVRRWEGVQGGCNQGGCWWLVTGGWWLVIGPFLIAQGWVLRSQLADRKSTRLNSS